MTTTSFFKEVDPNHNTTIPEIQTNKRRKTDGITGDNNTSLKDFLNTISFTDDPEIPDLGFQITNSDFKFGSEVMKARQPKFDATVMEESSSHGGGQRLWGEYDECPNEDFKKAFRMTKSTFYIICDELKGVITRDLMLLMDFPVQQCVAVCLYHLATGDKLQTVSTRFGLRISTCHKLILQVCTAIKNVLMPKFLRWPDDERLEEIKTEFRSISGGIPNVSGSIYTTHISISVPKVSAAAYLNERHTERNQRPSYSTTVQGVVDSLGVFTDICVGYPGSMSDDKILEKSALSQRFNTGNLKNIWVVGNSGYPLLDWLLVPYTHPNLTSTQHSMNEKIKDIQKIAKDAFVRLKGRWKCLQKQMVVKPQDLPVVIGACCVLHNICEINGEAMDPDLRFDLLDDEIPVADNGGGKPVIAVQARDSIAHNLLRGSDGGPPF